MSNADTMTQYGYTYEGRVDRNGHYFPIDWADLGRPAWFNNLEDAEKARQNDLRWRVSTFIITREVTAPTRYGKFEAKLEVVL